MWIEMAVEMKSGNKNCGHSCFVNEMDAIFPSQVLSSSWNWKHMKNLLFNTKKFYQRTKRDIQQEKHVIQSENLFNKSCYPIMQYRVILLENVLSIVKRGIRCKNVLFNVITCKSVQKHVIESEKRGKNANQL